MRVKHKNYTSVRGRIIQFVHDDRKARAVILMDYRMPSNGEAPGEGRFVCYPIDELIPDPPDMKWGI